MERYFCNFVFGNGIFVFPSPAEEVKSIDRASGVLGNAVAPTGIPTDDVKNVTENYIC